MNDHEAAAAETRATIAGTTEAEARRTLLRAGNVALALPICGVGATVLMLTLGHGRSFEELSLGLIPVTGALAFGAALVALNKRKLVVQPVSHLWIWAVGLVGLLGGGAMFVLGGMMSMLVSAGGRGRQIRSFGKPLLPPVVPGNDWSANDVHLDICANLDLSTRQGLAQQWRENGRTEHASVAAFAELTRELIALGAPPELLVSANRDALDEIRHAEACFALAKSLDGSEESPGAFPAAGRSGSSRFRPRNVALASLAVASLIDGVLHEGVSARILARLVKRIDDETVRAMVKQIAADEGRHAAHGWDVVRWCVSEGGAPVVKALRGAVAAIPSTSASEQPAAAKDGSWEPFGIHGDELGAEEYRRAVADVQRRVANLWAVAAEVEAA